MTIVGCYARKSNIEDGKDEDAKSVSRQVHRAREFAAKKGWAFDERFIYQDDGISGAVFDKRPGLQAMLSTLEKFDVLIVSELSRLGRQTSATYMLIERLEDAGVEVLSYLDGQRINVE